MGRPMTKTLISEGSRLVVALVVGFALALVWPSSWKREDR